LELADRGHGPGRVHIVGLEEPRIQPRRHVVERALAGPIRIDRARQRDDADDLRARARSSDETLTPDRVEADPDRPHSAEDPTGRDLAQGCWIATTAGAPEAAVVR